METFKSTNKLVILNGYATAGKDELVSIYSRLSAAKGGLNYVNNMSSVDHAKMIAKKFFMWDGVKDDKGRQLLADLKDAGIKYNNLPYHMLAEQLHSLEHQTVFYHCREPEQIAFIKEQIPEALTVCINRPSVKDDSVAGNAQVYDVEYDVVIDNTSDYDAFENACVAFWKDHALLSIYKQRY